MGLRALKEAVRFHNPQYSRPENIPITWKIKVAVRSAHAKYLKRIEESKKQDEIRKQRENKRRCLRRGGQLKKEKKP